MNRYRWLCLAGVAIAGSLSGCAIYDPWQVWRYQADYNTERAISAQIAFYDHLPLSPVRTRLIQWSYNVGPPGIPTSPAAFAIPDGAPIGPGLTPPASPPATSPLPPPLLPPAPSLGAPARPSDLLDRSGPPDLPPASPSRTIVPPGPTANSRTIQRLSGTTESPPTSAAWLFAH